jgi:hypothetical protein
MKKVDIQEVTRFINKLEEKFNALDINNEVVRGNVSKDFAVVKGSIKKKSKRRTNNRRAEIISQWIT